MDRMYAARNCIRSHHYHRLPAETDMSGRSVKGDKGLNVLMLEVVEEEALRDDGACLGRAVVIR